MKKYIVSMKALLNDLILLGLIIACLSLSSLFADTMHGQWDFPFGGGFQMCCRDDDVSNTFMFTRPVLQNTSTRQALWHTIQYTPQTCGVSFQVTGIFQQSIALWRTKHYFLPGKIDRVLVTGDAVTKDLETRQIRAEWLNLPSTFQGTFTLNPKQLQAGILLECDQDIGALVDHGFFEGTWLSFCAPLVFVENNMNISQDVFATTASVNDLGQANPTDIIEAFMQKDWWFGKIRCGPLTKTRLADINIQLGKTFMARDNFLVASYTSLIIPTGNIQDAQYLFEPVSGNNGHFGYGAGVNFQIPITSAESQNPLCFFLDFESIFFARNKQWRTFDLKGKPYSRYLQFVSKDDPTGELIPGVNILTRHVQVHPYNLADLSTGFRLQIGQFEFEIGYSIWGHGDEKIIVFCDDCMRRIIDGTYGIAGNPNVANQLPAVDACQNILPATASKSTIACQASNDVLCAQTVALILGDCAGPFIDENGDEQRVFVPITREDIDVASAEGKSAFNHKFQCAVGLVHKGCNVDMFFGIGGYYDKPVKSGALNTLGAWTKIGATF